MNAATRAKISAALKGRKKSLATRRKIGKASRGRKHTAETRARMSESRQGRVLSAETKKKIGASNRGKRRTPVQLARMSASQVGRKHTDETKARISTSLVGRRFSADHVKNLRLAHSGHPVSLEQREKISIALSGRKLSPAMRARRSASRLKYLQEHPMPTGPAHWAWRGGDRKYGGGFTKDLKRIIRWLYGGRCFLCGEKPGGRELDVHHIDYDKKNHVIDNLVPLCISCHSRTGIRRARWTRLLRSRQYYFPFNSWELVA